MSNTRSRTKTVPSRETSRERTADEDESSPTVTQTRTTEGSTSHATRDPNQEPTNYEIFALLQEINTTVQAIWNTQGEHSTQIRVLEGDIRSIRNSITTVPGVQPSTSTQPTGKGIPLSSGFAFSNPTDDKDPFRAYEAPPKPRASSSRRTRVPPSENEDSEGEGLTIKIKAPDAFDGKERGKAINQWIIRMLLVVSMKKHARMSEREKMMFFLSNTKELAADWAQPRLEKLFSDNLTGEVRNLESLCNALRTAFGDPDAHRAAVRKINDLTQTGTASDYTTTFQTIAAELDWDQNTLRDRYWQGLYFRVKESISNRETQPDSLQALMNVAILVDNIRRENEANKPKQTPRITQPARGSSTTPRSTIPSSDTPNFVPKEEKERRKKEGLCIKCGRKGHGFAECRTGWKMTKDEGKEDRKDKGKGKEKGNVVKIEEETEEIGGSESENE